MPHPDRSSEALLGSDDGLQLFLSMAQALAAV
jgi:phosphoribosylformylglycinamidine synthase